MRFDELFEQRSLVASKLKDCLRDKGYTKVSFAKKAEISRPTLDKLLIVKQRLTGIFIKF